MAVNDIVVVLVVARIDVGIDVVDRDGGNVKRNDGSSAFVFAVVVMVLLVVTMVMVANEIVGAGDIDSDIQKSW